MKYKSTIFSCIISVFILISGLKNTKAQERVSQLDGNPALQNYLLKHKSTKSVTLDTLELPFFDDFSDSYLFPNQNKWVDNYAFINGTYPINPPSIGVATLDAIDNQGEFYDDAGYGNYFSADTLSSHALNLNFPGDNTIYLSFYYQPQGKGDNPETGDSLLLEFYAPVDTTWTKVWDTVGMPYTDFQQKIIHINEDKYLKDGFRFRFRNIASLSGDKEPSKAINVDHWHIDYVYLNRNRSASDLNHRDIAFVYPMASHLKYYESMPWKHFLFNPSGERSTNVNVIYKNNDNKSRLIDSIYFVFYDNSGNEPNDTLFGGAYDILAGETRVFNPPFTYPFLTNTSDSASFTVKARFVTDDYDNTVNNEVLYIQRFYDYYAYDDGSAEAGYGLTGDGAQNAQLAYKFDCKKQDTLKAVQMYFNRSLFDKSQKYFSLTIWDDNEGIPGQIIYQKEAVRPEYENELNKFHTYFIDDTTLILNRVFYVGWVQTTSDMLNIGLDFNRSRNENIFYNISGNWENSKYEAALMIRPFFGKKLTTAITPEPSRPEPEISIFPNPTKNQLTISISNFSDYKEIIVQIYNLAGRQVYQSNYKNQSLIELSGLTEGIYLLRLTNKQKTLNYTQKIIKIK